VMRTLITLFHMRAKGGGAARTDVSVSGVNYSSRRATIILPYRRQLLSFHSGSILLN